MAGQIVASITGSTGLVESTVSQHLSQMQTMANSAFSTASSLAQSLGNFAIPSMAIDMPGLNLGDIDLPEAPNAPSEFGTISADFPDPGKFSGPTATSYTPGVAPTFGGRVPVLGVITAPEALRPFDESPPTIDTITLPEAPSFVDIKEPSFVTISVPTAPSVANPTFNGSVPDFNVSTPTIGITWSENSAASEVTGLTNRLSSLLAEQANFDSAENAIWGRGQERLARATDEAATALWDEFAKRGFSMPSGVVLEAQMELRAKALDQRADNARDAMIKAAEHNLAKLTLAIQSGVAYQGAWMNYQSQIAERALAAERAMVDVGVNLFEASVAVYNAKIEAFKAGADVYRSRIQAESLRLEQYRIQIDGERAKGEINRVLVDKYLAQHKALEAKADIYRSRIAGAQAQADLARLNIESFKGLIEAHQAKASAKASEFQAFGEQIRAEVARAGIFDSQVRAFSAQVQAYATGEETKQKAALISIENLRAQASAYQARVQGVAAVTNQQIALLQQDSTRIEAQMRAYTANASVYEAVARSITAKAEAETRRSLGVAEIALRRAQVITEANMRASGIEMQAIEAAGRTAAQLAGSAMAAVNVHAGMSTSFSSSLGNSLGESWSGSIATNQG